MRKLIFAFILALLVPTLSYAQAGTAPIVKQWYVLDEATDIRSGDAGCYKPSQVTFATGNLQILQTATSTTCGYTGSQNSPATGTTTQSYRSGSIISNFTIQPTAGHPVHIDASAKLAHGWPALWLLGAACQQTSLYTWDNTLGSSNPIPPPHTCNWAQDSNDSSEIDFAESNANADGGAYLSIGHNVWTGSGTVLAGGCSETVNPSTISQFHTYHMDWSTTSLHMWTDSNSGGGCTYNSGVPTGAMFMIIQNRQASGNVDNNLPSTMQVAYVQICDGTSCTIPQSSGGNTTFYDNFSAAPLPVIDFTDLTSGPNTGGENNNGTILTIYGRNFGFAQGTSTVTIGGGAVAQVRQWGAKSKAGSAAAQLETISVAIGSAAATGTVTVTTPAGASLCADTKDNCQFTVRSGNIRCVSTSGSNANAGTFPSSCWATIPFAKNSLTPGDIAYVTNGVSTGATIDNYNATVAITGNNCTAALPCAMVVYPGATATIGTSAVQYGLRTPAVGGVKDYWTIAGFNILGLAAMDLLNVTGWRVINNDFTCPNGSGQSACMHTDTTTQYRFYGNYTHNVGDGNATIDKFYHGNYYTTNSNHIWSAWNEINNNPNGSTTSGGCRAVQFFSTGGSDQFDLHVHDNYIHNAICDGLNFSTVNPDSGGTVEAYNNVIFHVGTGPAPNNGVSDYACLTAGGGGTGPVLFYNNTLYDCGGIKVADSGTVYVARPVSMWNNISQQLSGEIYLTSSSVAASLNGSNNDWFGGGTAPTQTTGNLTVDPLFSSAGTTFTLQSSSPMLGAGTAAHTDTWDFNDLVRPSPPAIGAYELTNGTFTPAPLVNLSSTSVTFANTTVGFTAPTINVVLTNVGTANLIIGSMTLTGTNPGDFSFSTAPASTCGTNVAANGTCTITLFFTPTATGSRSAILSIGDNATGTPHTVSLSGTGQAATAPIASLNPTLLNFSTNQNTVSAGQTTVLTNTGTANLIVSSVSTSGLFNNTGTGTCTASFTLAPGANCTFVVTFTPNATGSFSGNLSINDNAAGSPHVVALGGTGTAPAISLTPASYPFGNVAINTTVNSTNFTLLNTGNGPLNVAFSIGGTNPSFFGVVTTTCPSSLAAGNSCSVSASFSPLSLTSYSATLVETDSVQSLTSSIALSGTGISGTAPPTAPYVPILVARAKGR